MKTISGIATVGGAILKVASYMQGGFGFRPRI